MLTAVLGAGVPIPLALTPDTCILPGTSLPWVSQRDIWMQTSLAHRRGRQRQQGRQGIYLHVLSGVPQRVRNRGARAPGLVRCSPGSRCSADASTDAVAGPVLGQETSWTPGLPHITYITYIQYCINVAS